jgi:hypothetical protein
MTPEELPRAPWHQKVTAVLFILLCFELAAFLVLYPWSDAWGRNWLFSLFPKLREYWISETFRGAVTGIGLLNLFIGVAETFRLRRFARRDPQ